MVGAEAEHPTTKEEYLLGYCFSSAYIISMLHYSLGFALDDGRIEFANKAGEKDIPLEWALGPLSSKLPQPLLTTVVYQEKMLGS
ncbi:unnamed protein product [Eruca vesicaria subsp. sativa]|uniref:Adenosine diphosphatase n=1 Tax=Eruca vesicaria subsp. sativa TaxID=29727 RepID=A0ABC8LGD2_ERUVS|nr:unnamed protein product [Eruca vesicaria subsp. sativa]